ncbi:MAG: M20 family metallopeptidase [Clostridia bacterium]|nr:M20 family metallopeptidase [Clostridia bacterium]
MENVKKAFKEALTKYEDELFAISCDIFAHPEAALEEYHASELWENYLSKQGFTVEKGAGNLPTAFRAVWERGAGGPVIGLMMEYDALRDLGHACGHHLQGAGCIGAALALRDICKDNFKLVLYGTPAEEHGGGKIMMADAGCFRDIDVMLCWHTGGRTSAAYSSTALTPTVVTFHGKSAHAGGSPWNGRSALDAMMLAFHGLEIMREHVKDGSRIHYTVKEGTGPSNIVPSTAKAHITLRTRDKTYLAEMRERMRNVVKGACLMTDTTADFEEMNTYFNFIPIPTLREIALGVEEELEIPRTSREILQGGGATDNGNVSWIVPTLYVHAFYGDYIGHTPEYRDAGTGENARDSFIYAAQILGHSALKLISDPSLIDRAKEEHKAATAE